MSKSNSPSVGFSFADLFAGIGGIRLALERSGGHCVFSSEWDRFAQKTYEANFGEIPRGDITKIKNTSIPKMDVLAAGFPCQPFSSIGKRQGFKHKTQGTLFADVLRIAKSKRPKVVLLENVTGLLTHNEGDTMATIVGALSKIRYQVDWRVLDASNFGVPQRRQRVYIVGFDRDQIESASFDWPKPMARTKRSAIGPHIRTGVEGYSISEHLQNVYIYKRDDGHPEVVTPESMHPVKTLVASYHKIQRITGTFVRDGATGLRLLTEDECKAIMGFPKDFIFPVSRTQMYRQMGNSVVVPVVERIGKKIARVLAESSEVSAETSSWRSK